MGEGCGAEGGAEIYIVDLAELAKRLCCLYGFFILSLLSLDLEGRYLIFNINLILIFAYFSNERTSV